MSCLALRRQRGFSLVELAVSLVIAGILGILIWRWTVAAQQPATLQAMQAQLSEAQAAVEGFVLVKHRLPCPASDTAGVEACGTSGAVLLPWRTLGMSSDGSRLHYGVNRGGGADLAALPAALPAAEASPDLNIEFTGVPVTLVPLSKRAGDTVDAASGSASASALASVAATQVQSLIAQAKAKRAVVNGLDWCRVLRRFDSTAGAAGTLMAGNIGGALPVAYIVVHPGANGQFEGSNVVGNGGSWRYDLPGREQDAQYDDLSLAVGPGDLSARLGCVARLGAAQAAAQTAFAQYDTTRVMEQYWSLRRFDLETAWSDVDDANTGVAMAALDLALTATSTAVGIASAANTEGVTAFALVIEAANVVIAVAQVKLAADDLVAANQALEDAANKLVASNKYAALSYQTLSATLQRSIALDGKGLNP